MLTLEDLFVANQAARRKLVDIERLRVILEVHEPVATGRPVFDHADSPLAPFLS